MLMRAGFPGHPGPVKGNAGGFSPASANVASGDGNAFTWGDGTPVEWSAAVDPPVTTGILAANRLQIPTTIANSVPMPYTSRRSHYASPDGNISNIQFVDVTYYIDNSYNLSGPVSPNTIKKFLEYPAGVFTQVTWSGSTSVAIPTNGDPVKSDPISITIPAGTKFWERTVLLSGSGSVAAIELPNNPIALGLDDGNVAADQGNSGTIAAGSSTTSIGSVAIIGDVAKTNARAFVLWGDSILFGQEDTSSVGTKGGSGYVARGIDPKYPWMKIAKSGSAAFNYTSNMGPYIALLAAIGYTDVYVEHGGGDLRQTRTVSQILADQQYIYSLSPGKRIYQSTILPRTDSTDGWATTANQTVKTDGNWSQLTNLNTSIRAPQSGVTGVIEASDIAMTARNSGIWTAPPSATPDGVHPNSTKSAALASALSSL